MPVTVGFQYGVPSELSPDESAMFIEERITALREIGVLDGFEGGGMVALESSPGMSQTPDDDRPFTIEDQLTRFASYWRTREPFLRAIHDGLVEIGYRPILPEVRAAASKTPASYIRYVDPINAQPLGYLNSGAFLFIGTKAKERMQGEKFVEESRDGMRVQFESEEIVDFIVSTAKEFKA